MLEKLIKLYASYMVFGTTGLLPHLVGPPGSGKSSVIEELAELVGADLHIINVSRLSPLEVEGVQMPHGEGADMQLRMLPATFWTQLKDGDIILFDEFLRGFPEVYNALLDIFTSRRVGAFRLPKVFMIGASNSITAYDEALADRLLNLPVADPRRRISEKKRIATMLVEMTGMHSSMAETQEMTDLLDEVVLPTFDVLDSLLDKKSKGQARTGGKSLRNLVSQVQLRYITSNRLKALIEANNQWVRSTSKVQYFILLGTERDAGKYEKDLRSLVGNPKLTQAQARNIEINLQLIELAKARKGTDEDD